MDLQYGAQYDTFRAELRDFLSAWPPTGEDAKLDFHTQEQRFREQAIARGYLYRDIPKQYGGSEQPNDPLRDRIIMEEFAKANVPFRAMSQGPAMLVPTLLEFGN